MPAPVVTAVIVVVVTAAAGFAFKEFVYEPHLAPRVEIWATNFLARRQARRRQRAGAQAHAIAVSVEDQSTIPTRGLPGGAGFELDEIPTRGVDEWRSEVGRSQTLRNRRNGGVPSLKTSALDQPNIALAHAPILPTHVIFDPSTPSTPTSDCVTRRGFSPEPASTPPRLPSHRSSRSTLRSPAIPPAGLSAAASPDITFNASLIPPTPSSHGDLDLDFLSTTSSPGSHFSDLAAATLQSPHVPHVGSSPQMTSPFVDPHDMDEFLSVSSDSGSDESDLSDDFGGHSPMVSTMSMGGSPSALEEDLEGSEVFSWASASARSQSDGR